MIATERLRHQQCWWVTAHTLKDASTIASSSCIIITIAIAIASGIATPKNESDTIVVVVVVVVHDKNIILYCSVLIVHVMRMI